MDELSRSGQPSVDPSYDCCHAGNVDWANCAHYACSEQVSNLTSLEDNTMCNRKYRVEGRSIMLVPVMLKILIYLSLLDLQITLARPHFSDARRMHEGPEMVEKLIDDKQPGSWWLSADYTLVHKRRSVHNALEP
ncbi:hypothetical protein Ancab_026973 [Ancistrocladus abbreviatus]